MLRTKTAILHKADAPGFFFQFYRAGLTKLFMKGLGGQHKPVQPHMLESTDYLAVRKPSLAHFLAHSQRAITPTCALPGIGLGITFITLQVFIGQAL